MSGTLAGSTFRNETSVQSDLAALGGGMKRIPFALESNQVASLPLTAKRLLNFYAEQEPSDARTAVALISTPGLTLDATYGSGPILAMNSDEPGRLYVASGAEFYRQVADLTGTHVDDLGAIGSVATDVLPAYARKVTIAVGPTACVVCVPPNAWCCSHVGALNQIGGTFPGAACVAYLDGYFVFTSYENSSQFFVSALLDPTQYNALSFAYSDGLPNVIRGAMILAGELWLAGESGLEVWYDYGDPTFPFLRRAVIDHGVATPQSLAIADDSLFWVGNDGVAYRSQGYAALRVSNHGIETILQENDPTSVVSGLSHSQSGHIFYCVTQGAQTFAYDCATKLWHNRSSSADGGNRWKPSASGHRGGVQLLGDSGSGKVFRADPNSGLEDGVVVLRQTIMPPIWAGTYRAFMNRLEIEMEVGGVGPGPEVLLEWSDDGGWTFTGSRQLNAGTFSQRNIRVVATRLGSFRQRVLRLTFAGRTTLYAVDADITAPKAGG